jgi:glycosyltransferase involved in cell wall biosynthesis
MEGDVVAPIWGRRNAIGKARVEAARRASGAFGYHVTFSQFLPAAVRAAWELLFHVGTGLALAARHGTYDVVVAYGASRPALAARIIAFVTRSRLIVEVPGNLAKSLMVETQHPTRLARLRAAVSESLARHLLESADRVKLLYPGQLEGLLAAGDVEVSVFANFVPVSQIAPGEESRPYLLSMGYPWRVKGMDLVIRAFHAIKEEFPELTLKIVGHCVDMSPYVELAAGDPRIELRSAVSGLDAVSLMRACRVYVLASRTEAMGRVLLEAMAAGKPIVASAVDGVPHYVGDGVNGVLFPPENVEALADGLRRVLRDPTFAERLGSRARDIVMSEYSEERYVANFETMIGEVLA